MAFETGLCIGQEVTFEDIKRIFKCGNMGGMLSSNKTNTMVIINDWTKELYKDEWKGEILYYTGTGKVGDQQLSGNNYFKNGILYNLGKDDRTVHLFEVMEKSVYTYRGEVELAATPYQDVQPGKDEVDRKVWIFPLRVIKPNRPQTIEFMDVEINLYEDIKLNEDISKTNQVELPETFQYKGEAKEKTEPVMINRKEIYRRNRKTSINALAYAGYFCEIDKNHETFKRKNLGVNYTEPHHLVPMEFSKDFNVSLDVEENIVSLCSNCHNWLHYGSNYGPLLKKLYDERNDLLRTVGIEVTFEELKHMYE